MPHSLSFVSPLAEPSLSPRSSQNAWRQAARVCFSLAMLAGATVIAQDNAAPSAETIIRQYVEGNASKSEMAYVKMLTETPGAAAVERRILLAYQKQEVGDSFFMRLLHPKEVEGVTLLATGGAGVEPNYYFLLPALGKMRQLTAEARQGAFLGSDYTFEDLLQEVPEAHHYERLADDAVDGADCYVVRATENGKEKASAYACRDLFIEKGNFHLRKIAFYDAKMSLVKLLNASGYDSKEIKGRSKRPQKAVMQSVASGSRTTFTVIEGRVDESIDSVLFTPKKLENWPLLDVEEFIFDLGISIDVN